MVEIAGIINNNEFDDLNVFDGYLDKRIYSQDIADIPSFLKNILLNPAPHIVLVPTSKEEVVRVIAYAKRKRIPIVPRGVGSSAYGGALPTNRGIVLDLSSMRNILDFDREKKLIKVETGVRWSDIGEFLKMEGFSLMSYPTSWFSTVGGWISTGGYGIHSLRFGHLSKQIDALSVVAMDGKIKSIKCDDPEFEFYFGTEGQMGIILDATLKVRERPEESIVWLLYFEDNSTAIKFIQKMLNKVSPAHVIYYNELFIKEINALLGEKLFRETPSLLVEFEDRKEETNFLQLTEEYTGITRATENLANYLWKNRFYPMKGNRLGPGRLASELVIPIVKIDEYLQKASKLGEEHGVNIGAEAHVLGEDNALLIVFFLTDKYKTIRYLRHLSLTMMLTRLGIDVGGKPYEIGIWNMPFLGYKFDKAYILKFEAYKRKVDPEGLLNPGKLFSLKSKFWDIPIKILRPSSLNPVLKFLIKISGVFSPSRTLGMSEHKLPEYHDLIEEAISTCVRCGSCTAVCPAYIITRNSKLTPRGKIISAKEFSAGKKISKEDAWELFLCMRCKACENVCQAGLKLTDIWDELERRLTVDFGRPTSRIEEFVKEVETKEAYKKLLEKDAESDQIKSPDCEEYV